jgi:hypothetical protein
MGRASLRRVWAAAGMLAVLVGATLALPGPPARADVGFRDAPYGTVAWTGSTAVVAETGTNGDLYYWYNPGGNTSWHEQTVATATTQIEYSDAAIAWTGRYSKSASSVVIVAYGDNGALYYWWQAAGTKTWHKQTVATGNAYISPTIGTTSDSVVIAAADGNGNVNYWYQPFGHTGWTHNKVAAGKDTKEFDSASIGWTGSTVVIAAGTTSGDVFYWWNPGGDTTWHKQTVALGAGELYYEEPSLGVAKDSVILAAVDTFGVVYYWYETFSTSTWHQQTVTPTTSGYGNPSIAWSGSTALITAANGNAGLSYFYQYGGTTTWHQQTVTPSGQFGEQGASITATSKATVITGIDNTDTPGNVDYYSQTFGTSPWNSETIASSCC